MGCALSCTSASTLFHFWVLVLNLRLFNDMVEHNRPLLHVVLHGTSVHSCHGELLFSYTNAVSPHRCPFLNEVTNKMVYRLPFLNKVMSTVRFVHESHVCSCTYTPIWWYTNTCRILSNVYTKVGLVLHVLAGILFASLHHLISAYFWINALRLDMQVDTAMRVQIPWCITKLGGCMFTVNCPSPFAYHFSSDHVIYLNLCESFCCTYKYHDDTTYYRVGGTDLENLQSMTNNRTVT